MDRRETNKSALLFGLTLTLILPLVAIAAGSESYRFPREPGTTKDGYPLPLAGTAHHEDTGQLLRKESPRSRSTRSTTSLDRRALLRMR